MSDFLRQAANGVGALGQAIVPALGYAGYLGKTVGSDVQSVKTGVVPADYTFIVWSFIFLFCLVYAAEQARPGRASDPLFRKIGWLTAFAFLANTAWSVVAQLQYNLIYTGLIFLVTLVTILPAAVTAFTATRDWRVTVAIGSLAGWVSIAIFANWSVIMKDLGWGGTPDPQIQALLFLSAAGLLVLAVLRRVEGNLIYLLTVIWALCGLVVGNLQRGETFTAAGAAVWLAVIALIGWHLLSQAKPAEQQFAN